MLSLASLIIVFFLTRLASLTIIPIFADEAIYIRWAQLIWQGRFFIPLSDGKTPLFMWLLAPILQVINNPLLAGRLLSVLSGLATLAGVFFLSQKLFNRKIAIISSFLVIFSPFLLFYDRMSLVDSLLTALIVWSIKVAYDLFKKPKLKPAIILGLLWAAALLTKPAALLFILLTPALLLLIPVKNWFKKIKKIILPGALAGIIAIGIYSLQRLSNAFHMINRRSADYLRSSSDFLNNSLEFIPATLKVFFTWLINYLSWPALVLLAITWILALKKKSKEIAFLSALIIIPFILEATIGKIIYPRYLLPIIPFILIILSWGLNNFKKIFSLIFIILIAVYWLKFDYLLLTNPVLTPLDNWEKGQYFYEWSAGYGLKEITDYLNNIPEDQSVLVATEGSFGTLPDGLQIFFNTSPNIHIQGIGFPEEKITPVMEKALSDNRQVYLVFNQGRLGNYNPKRLKLIAEYPRPKNEKPQEKLLFFKVLLKN